MNKLDSQPFTFHKISLYVCEHSTPTNVFCFHWTNELNWFKKLCAQFIHSLFNYCNLTFSLSEKIICSIISLSWILLNSPFFMFYNREKIFLTNCRGVLLFLLKLSECRDSIFFNGFFEKTGVLKRIYKYRLRLYSKTQKISRWSPLKFIIFEVFLVVVYQQNCP